MQLGVLTPTAMALADAPSPAAASAAPPACTIDPEVGIVALSTRQQAQMLVRLLTCYPFESMAPARTLNLGVGNASESECAIEHGARGAVWGGC